MSMTDPVADFLTRIRNAQSAHKEWVDIPCSNLKKRVAFVLKEEKYIRDMLLIKDNKQDILRLFLNYDMNNESVIKGIQRISKPGCRNYVTSDTLPRVLNGLGISVISSSKGVISNKVARELKVGGELLCNVW